MRMGKGSEHTGHRERLKRRFAREGNLEGFEPHEMLELLLYYAIPQGDTNPLAHRLIEEFGSLPAVLEASPEELRQVQGVGAHTASLLTLMMPLASAVKRLSQQEVRVIRGVKEAAQLARQLMQDAKVERVALIMMDAKGKVVRTPTVAEGTACSVEMPIPRIVEWVVRVKPASLILVHNHPGGNAEPSYQDDHGTRQLLMAMRFMEVAVSDHIVVGETESYSYEREGRMEGIRRDANVRAGQGRVAYQAWE